METDETSEDQAIKAFFGRTDPRGGRPTKEEAVFRDTLKKLKIVEALDQLGFLEKLQEGSLLPGNGDLPRTGDVDRGSDRDREGTFQRLIGRLVSGLGKTTQEVTVASLAPVLATAGGPIALILAWWLAEDAVDQMPKILHSLVHLLNMGLIPLTDALVLTFQALTKWILWLINIVPDIPQIAKEAGEEVAETIVKVDKAIKESEVIPKALEKVAEIIPLVSPDLHNVMKIGQWIATELGERLGIPMQIPELYKKIIAEKSDSIEAWLRLRSMNPEVLPPVPTVDWVQPAFKDPSPQVQNAILSKTIRGLRKRGAW